MFYDRADGDRFFARVRALDLACPRCDRVYSCGEGRRGKDSIYDRTRSIFQCPFCGLTLAIGIIAWPMRPGPVKIPEDTVPTYREAMALRELMGLGGIVPDPVGEPSTGNIRDQRHGTHEPVNVVIRGECRCRRVEPPGRGRMIHPGCPVHGEGKRR
jgi:hypothetical protein